jgi:hypothetical protein
MLGSGFGDDTNPEILIHTVFHANDAVYNPSILANLNRTSGAGTVPDMPTAGASKA